MRSKPKPAQERNPYSDSASKVLRAALSAPGKAWGVRELARLGDVSPALAVLALKRLERLGHVSRESSSQVRILDPVALVRDWAAWYCAKPLKAFRFSIPNVNGPLKIMNLLRKHRSHLPGKWALSWMAGASLAMPHSVFSEVHVHLPKAERFRRSWQDVLGLVPEKLGSIHLVQPYYAESVADDIRIIKNLPVVSDLQLYLDCLRYPVRGREQAEHILSRILEKRWKDG